MSWLFKQVWVWILIAFLLGLILTWIYVVHKASRTVDAPGEPQQVPEETHPAPPPDDQEPAEDQAELAAETAEPGRDEQQAGPTVTPASRDDQPEAAGAAAAAAARARADEQTAAPKPTEPSEPVGPTEPAEPSEPVGPTEPAEPSDVDAQSSDVTDSPLGAEQTSMGATDVSPSVIHRDDHEIIGEMATSADETPTVGEADTTEPAAGQVGTVAAGGAAVAGASAESQPSDAAPTEDEPIATDESTATTDSGSAEDPAVQRFGPGAASTLPDGSAPPGHPIKGNVDSMLFHTKDSPRYAATSPGVWFADEASATAAGFAHWDRTKRGTSPSHLAHTAPDDGAAPPQPAAEDAPVTEEAPATEEPVEEEPVEAAPAIDEPVDEDDPITAQFGSGAASPREDGSAPSPSYTIKGDADTMTFHTQDSPRFAETEAEIWFRDEASAKAAGFLHWDRSGR